MQQYLKAVSLFGLIYAAVAIAAAVWTQSTFMSYVLPIVNIFFSITLAVPVWIEDEEMDGVRRKLVLPFVIFNVGGGVGRVRGRNIDPF